MVLYALHDLAAKPGDEIQQGSASKGETLEIFTYLHFVWFSSLVPVYVRTKLVEVIQRILANPTFHRSIIFSPSAWPKVKVVLQEWLEVLMTSRPCDEMTQVWMDAFRQHQETHRIESPKVDAHIETQVLNAKTLARVLNFGKNFNAREEKMEEELTRRAQQYIFSLRNSVFETQFENVLPDVVFAIAHEILPPPVSLLSHHSQALQEIYEFSKDSPGPASPATKLEGGVGIQISRTIHEGLDPQMLLGEYIINHTALDPVFTDPGLSRIYPDQDFLPADSWDSLSFMSTVFSSSSFNPPASCTTLFDLSCHFWEKAALAVGHLLADSGSSLCFEIVDCDMNEVARDLSLESNARRAWRLPSRFLRAFTSNVPDYTGLLYPMLDIAPLLLPSPKAFIRLSVMYSHSSFADPPEFVRSKLVLKTAKLLQQFYGFRLHEDSRIPYFLFLEKDLAASDQQDSSFGRDMLFYYLLDVFIGVALPPLQRPEYTKDDIMFFHLFPESLVVFMETVVHALQSRR